MINDNRQTLTGFLPLKGLNGGVNGTGKDLDDGPSTYRFSVIENIDSERTHQL